MSSDETSDKKVDIKLEKLVNDGHGSNNFGSCEIKWRSKLDAYGLWKYVEGPKPKIVELVEDKVMTSRLDDDAQLDEIVGSRLADEMRRKKMVKCFQIYLSALPCILHLSHTQLKYGLSVRPKRSLGMSKRDMRLSTRILMLRND